MSFADTGAQIVTAGVEHGEIEVPLRMSRARSDFDRANGKFRFFALENIYVMQPRLVGIDRAGLLITVEKGADGIMRGHTGQIKHRRADEALINLLPVSE